MIRKNKISPSGDHAADPSARSLFSFGDIAAFIVIGSVIAFIYSNAFRVPFVFDDDGSIVANELIHIYRFSQFTLSWLVELIKATRSVALFSFALNFYFGGLNVFGYHLANLCIHILASCTVYLFVRSTLNVAGFAWDRSVRVAGIVSFIFAVHPVQTQAVTYIVQRETSMATLFYLWSFLSYIKARITNRRFFFIFTALFFVLAVGTKQNSAVLPITLLGYEFFFFQKGETGWLRRNLLLLAGAVSALLVCGVIYTGPHIAAWFIERYAERPFTMLQRILTQPRVILHYLTLLFFPAPARLNLDYDFPVSYGFTPTTAIAIAFLVVALVLMARLSKTHPVISFFIFWFYTNLAVESSFLALEMVYEHRLYLPSMGIFVISAVILQDHVLRFPQRRLWGLTGLAIVGVILCIFTFERNKVWRNEMTLWSDVIKKSPYKSRPYNNLGNAYLRRGDPRGAIKLHQRAIRLDSKNIDAHYNLANDYLQINRIAAAIEFYKKTIRLKPDHAKAYANLGTVYNNLGRYDEAITQARLALKHRPHYVDVHYNLANAYFYKKDYSRAVKHYRHVIAKKPDHDRAFNNIGGVYLITNQPEKAIQHFLSAIRLSPQAADYVNNLGMAYKNSGNRQEAIKAFHRAIKIKPDYFDPYFNLSRTFLEQNKIPPSIRILSSYLRIRPNNARANMFMGLIFADYTAEKTKAEEFLQKALQLDPNLDNGGKIREKINIINKAVDPE